MQKIALSCFFILYNLICIAQQYSYTNYTDKEGLASNTVYSMCQDKDGFLWFGTAAGASRFDGTHFRNFTTADGLPDNEIIYTYCDKKGRVWMAPFRKSICYYYKGKIYNSENDPVLKKLSLEGVVLKICDDANGNMVLMTKNCIYIISDETNIRKINKHPQTGKPCEFLSVGPNTNGNVLIMVSDYIYEYNCNSHFLKVFNRFVSNFISFPYSLSHSGIRIHADQEKVTAYSTKKGVSIELPIIKENIGFSYLNDTSFFRNTTNGSWLFDFSSERPLKKYLSGIKVSSSFKDGEGSLWFTSLEGGIFRLNSDIITYIPFYGNNGVRLPAVNILPGWQKDLIITHSGDYYTSFDPAALTMTTKSRGLVSLLAGMTYTNHIERLVNNDLLYGMNMGLYFLSAGTGIPKWGINGASFKDIAKTKDDHYIVATAINALKINPSTMKVDTILNERTTSVFYRNDTIYLGTLDGVLLLLPNKKSVQLWKEEPLFTSRVLKIKQTDNGILWFATYNNGVIGYRDGKVVTVINEANGLNSNTCRNLYADGNILWVATAKGVCKIDAAAIPAPRALAKYGKEDGLTAEAVNAVYVHNSKVFIATDEGLNHFDEQQFYNSSICKLKITDMKVSGMHMPIDTNDFYVPRLQSDLEINYAGISFKSGGDIIYHYKLIGLDTGWRITRDTKLSYPSLMPGDYELQLYAVNKFGVKSNTLQIRFAVKKAFWEKTGVRIVAGLVLSVLILLLTLWRINVVRKREFEKSKLTNAIAELEQLAMKSQMNPHFIFNSLNSIQQFVIDKDVEGANRFISSFSRLIRQTLDFSSRKEITLQEEMNYLKDYLLLEKNRLGEKYNYSVESDATLNRNDIYIPPLLLQPYVENAIRHGIRYRTDNNGFIKLYFYKKVDRLVCVIEDNGIGRDAAMLRKTANPIEYQSKGMSLTAKRVEALNRKNEMPITIDIEDMYDETGGPAGTRVSVCFPLVNSY